MSNQFRPKLRREVEIDLNAFVNALMKRNDFPFQNCISCCHFTEATELCKHWNAKPPARVIAYGCSNYQDETEIPY